MIGYIGLGKMGGALARRLARHHNVLGFDLNQTIRDQASINVTSEAKEVAENCEMIFLCLPTSEHVETAVLGPGGLAAHALPGTVFVDQTSGDPKITRRIAAELAGQGHSFVDAPVSGGPQGADAGTIAVMVGCDGHTFTTILPVLRTISSNVFHAGETGCGHVAKLANNLLSSSIRMATLECITLAVKNGLSPEVAIQIFSAGGGGSFWLNKYGQSLMVEGKLGGTFALGLINKDVRLACQLGVDVGMPMFFGNLSRSMYQMALNTYASDDPVNTIAFLVEKISGADFIPKVG
jgi:3-hydroxyisobutyrate dehydrogenase